MRRVGSLLPHHSPPKPRHPLTTLRTPVGRDCRYWEEGAYGREAHNTQLRKQLKVEDAVGAAYMEEVEEEEEKDDVEWEQPEGEGNEGNSKRR